MTRIAYLTCAGLVAAFAGLSITTEPAAAVIYCKTVGVPQGCVARAHVAPVARAVARPGTAMNRGGPVNRVGRR